MGTRKRKSSLPTSSPRGPSVSSVWSPRGVLSGVGGCSPGHGGTSSGFRGGLRSKKGAHSRVFEPRCERWDASPSWTAVAGGARPDAEADTRLGEWPHGWQLHASHSQLLLSRPHDAAVVDAGPPSPASLPVKPAHWRVADGHARPAGHDVVAAHQSHAGGPAQASPLASAASPDAAEAWTRMWWRGRGCGWRGPKGRWCRSSGWSTRRRLGVPADDRRRVDLTVYGATPLGLAFVLPYVAMPPSLPHHDFADGRSARHRGNTSDARCRFCASCVDSRTRIGRMPCSSSSTQLPATANLWTARPFVAHRVFHGPGCQHCPKH